MDVTPLYSRNADGHVAFSKFSMKLRDHLKLSAEERAAAAECARAVARSLHCSPADLGGEDGTNFAWACSAGLVDIASAWLTDPRCSAAVVQHRDEDGQNAFSRACYWARDHERKLSAEERAAAAECARAVARSPQCSPADLGGEDGTNLMWACTAGLVDVVSAWLTDPRCSAAVLQHRDKYGDNAFSTFSIACYWARDLERKLSAEERAASAECARAVARSPQCSPADLGGEDGTNLTWACTAGLVDIVRTWLTDPRCSAAVVQHRDEDGQNAFSRACYWARDHERKLSAEERAAAAECARAVARSPHCSPADSGGNAMINLSWAVECELTDILEYWDNFTWTVLRS